MAGGARPAPANGCRRGARSDARASAHASRAATEPSASSSLVRPPPTLDVAIVAYRSRELLAACLGSLEENLPAAATHVYVVDNASGDGTVETVRTRFPDVHLDASDTNLGFGAATNRMIRVGSSKYVLALNPDTRLTPGSLDRLLELMEQRPEVGILGC